MATQIAECSDAGPAFENCAKSTCESNMNNSKTRYNHLGNLSSERSSGHLTLINSTKNALSDVPALASVLRAAWQGPHAVAPPYAGTAALRRTNKCEAMVMPPTTML